MFGAPKTIAKILMRGSVAPMPSIKEGKKRIFLLGYSPIHTTWWRKNWIPGARILADFCSFSLQKRREAWALPKKSLSLEKPCIHGRNLLDVQAGERKNLLRSWNLSSGTPVLECWQFFPLFNSIISYCWWRYLLLLILVFYIYIISVKKQLKLILAYN